MRLEHKLFHVLAEVVHVHRLDDAHLGTLNVDLKHVDYLVSRYGNFVRYRPPFDGETALLWIGPFAALAVGLAGLLLHLRKRARRDDTPLQPDERDRAARLLASLPQEPAP